MVSRSDERRADAAAASAQGELIGRAEVDRPVRRVEAAVQASIAAAALDPEDGGAAAVAVELALAVDVGSHRKDPYAVEAAARTLAVYLEALRLTPASRAGSVASGAAELLASLRNPTGGTASTTGPST